MDTINKIIELLAERNLEQQALTDYLGLHKSTFTVWKSGKSKSYKKYIEKIAEFFQVSTDTLLYHSKSESNIAGVFSQDKIYRIPVFATVSAGFGSYAEDDIVDYLPMLIDNPYDVDDTIAIKVKGDSMYPKIEDGDIIVVRKQESVDSGDIAVMLLDGEEGLVKKVVYGPTWIELHSLNPDYKTRRFDNEEVLRLRVVGKVQKVVKTL